MSRRIDAAEHDSGLRPLGEYPDHCEQCKRIHECEHEHVQQVVTFGGEVMARFCETCGVRRP